MTTTYGIPIEDEIYYSDINLMMDRSARDEIVYQEQAVTNSVHYLLGTPRRQRLMRPRWGSFLLHMLFEPVDDRTAGKIGREVYDAIVRNENRVEIERSGVNVTPVVSEGKFQVDLTYRLIELNNLQVSHQFKLRSLRN